MKRRDFSRSFGRAYDGPRLRNPFFSAPPAKVAKYLVIGIILSAVIGIPAVVVYAPFMRYDAVTVHGLTTLDPALVTATAEDVLNRRRLLVLPGRHLFLARTDKVAEALDAEFHFDRVTLRREGRALVIDVRERITEIAWTVAGTTYFVDLAGTAVREATPEALAMIAARRAGAAEIPDAPGVQPTMPIVDVVDGAAVVPGAVVIEADRLARILAIDAGLRTRDVTPLVYTLNEDDAAWLTVATRGGPSVLFDLTDAPDEAFVMYEAIGRERDGDLSSLLYIDLRFGNHVYVR